MADEEKQTSDFDFDEWSKMAQQDPEKFEVMRQQLIDDLIEKTPDHFKQRIVGLQWQIDQIRKQANNPMAACLKISQQMWNTIVGEKGLLNALQEPETISNTPKNEPSGKILSLDEYKYPK